MSIGLSETNGFIGTITSLHLKLTNEFMIFQNNVSTDAQVFKMLIDHVDHIFKHHFIGFIP